MTRFAAIDIGTNSAGLLVADFDSSGKLRVILDRSCFCRLGHGRSQDGRIPPHSFERGLETLSSFKRDARDHGAGEIFVVGTMFLRSAGNAPAFIEAAKKEYGLQIEIIDGREEARLTFLSVVSDFRDESGRMIICDPGGGSTEIIFSKSGKVENSWSLRVGAVSISEEFLETDLPGKLAIETACAAIEERLGTQVPKASFSRLIGVGGGLTTMSMVSQKLARFDLGRVHGFRLRISEVAGQIALYSSIGLEERKKIPGLSSDRADIILAGALIVRSIMERQGASELTVSCRGLRYGLLIDRFSKIKDQ